MAQGGPHPTYATAAAIPANMLLVHLHAMIGDEVALPSGELLPLGVVTDIHGETFGDGTGDTITIHPAAVTLSTGDRYPVADLVLLRRAER